jgi:hypothetical protein
MAPEPLSNALGERYGVYGRLKRPAPSSAGRGPGAEHRSGEAHLPISTRPLNAGQLLSIGGDPWLRLRIYATGHFQSFPRPPFVVVAASPATLMVASYALESNNYANAAEVDGP